MRTAPVTFLLAIGGASLSAQGQSSLTPSATPESVPGGALMLVAYAVAWVVVLLYVTALWRKSRTMQEELRDLHARLRSSEGKR